MRGALRALIFDVDGTLAETEEVHRTSFNKAFEEHGLPWRWSVEEYRTLLKTTGGKERILAFAQGPAAVGGLLIESLRNPILQDLHRRKTELYTTEVRSGRIMLRDGIAELIACARERGLRLAIATTTSRPNVDALLEGNRDLVDPAWFEVMACGDEVQQKKPDPAVYLLALERMGIAASEALAIEDSWNGVEAARRAGVPVAAIPGIYTAGEDLSAADYLCANAFQLIMRLQCGGAQPPPA
jgi:HAD superfamily hydrolase (TIGR01509 family)